MHLTKVFLFLCLLCTCSSCLLSNACLTSTFDYREKIDQCRKVESVHLDKDSTLIIQFQGKMQGDTSIKSYHLRISIDSLHFGSKTELSKTIKRADGKCTQLAEDNILLELKHQSLRKGSVNIDSSSEKISFKEVYTLGFKEKRPLVGSKKKLLAKLDSSNYLWNDEPVEFRYFSSTKFSEELWIKLAQKKKPFRFYWLFLLPFAILLDIILSPFYLIGFLIIVLLLSK